MTSSLAESDRSEDLRERETRSSIDVLSPERKEPFLEPLGAWGTVRSPRVDFLRDLCIMWGSWEPLGRRLREHLDDCLEERVPPGIAAWEVLRRKGVDDCRIEDVR